MRNRVQRYEKNPFLEGMIVPIKNRQVKLSKLGGNDNILISQTTGEVHGTHVTTYKQVDGAQFIKLFTQNIAMTFGLSSAGIKTFSVLGWAVQSKALAKDEIAFDTLTLKEFLEHHQDNDQSLKLQPATFKRGIVELERAQIIAKTLRQGIYFINPNFVFNGDRIAFSTVIERRQKKVPNLEEKIVDKTGEIEDTFFNEKTKAILRQRMDNIDAGQNCSYHELIEVDDV